MPRQEIRGELRNVLAPQPERRHVDVDPAEPVEQVRAEEPAREELRQRTVGGDDVRVSTRRTPVPPTRSTQLIFKSITTGRVRYRAVRR